MIHVVFAIALLFLAETAQAAIRYISPTGSNGNTGISSVSPWLTWAHAFANTSCGDTLIVMSGTYTATHGASNVTKVCTSSTVYLIKAQSERAAYIDGSSGTFIPFTVSGAAYITVDGLRARGGDLAPASGGVNTGVCNVYNSTHITFRHMLCTHPNRYRNAGHVYLFYNTTDSLLEENEAYYFHRHGFYIGSSSHRNTIRRNYCNGRNYDDLSVAGVENPTDGPSEVGPDDCYIVYPGNDNVFENNIAEGDQLKCYAVEAINPGSIRNKFYGNICLGGAWNGISLDARGSTSATMPTDTYIKDMFIEGTTNHGDTTQTASTYRFNANKNTSCINCTAIGTVGGFAVDRIASQPGDGIYSATLTNSLALNVTRAPGTFSESTGYGFRIAGVIGAWTATNINAYNSENANYDPSTHANYDPLDTPTSTDPGMGTCKVWRPAGSAAKTNNWGADILFRYEAGILTTIKLWNSVTGEFPHGAFVAGVNTISGSSPFDVHERLNINRNGCSFPAGYGGSNPTNPSNVVATTNLDGSHVQVVNAGVDSLIVAVLVQHNEFVVADPLTLTSSCGSESIPALTAVWYSASGNKSIRVFGKLNPTAGTCTITPTFSSGNVSGWVLISVTEDNVASFGNVSAASGLSGTPASTVALNTGDRILNFLTTSSLPPISAGDNQILLTDTVHTTKDLRGALSTQLGTYGGVMDYTLGSATEWITQNIVLATGGGGTGSTFRVSNYRIDGLLGVTENTEVTLGALGTQNQPVQIGTSGAFRLRVEIIAETAPSTITGTSLHCRKNGGGYAQVVNAFGSNVIRFYGAGVEPNIPIHDTPTAQTFSGSFTAGRTWRDGGATMVLGVISANFRTEIDYQLVLGNGIAGGDTVECEIRRDDGSTLGTHTVRPTVTAVSGQAAMGY
jgi:hypothetical protein